MQSFLQITGENPRQKVIDIGAAHIAGDPVYAPILRAGNAELIGFEPDRAALEKLNEIRRPGISYIGHAVGDGRRHTLHICAARDMTSLLPPNPEVLNLFHGFPTWGQVVATEVVDTVRLDDVPETAGATFIEMDIQGAELMVLRNARERLRDAVVLHLEVEFMPLYRDQPLYSDIAGFLHEHGFILHRFKDMTSRVVQPLMIDNNVFAGLSQVVWADAVFIRDYARADLLNPQQLLASAAILHDCYGSVDVAHHMLKHYDSKVGGNVAATYLSGLARKAA
jgi:FkbM family methyltransferase